MTHKRYKEFYRYLVYLLIQLVQVLNALFPRRWMLPFGKLCGWIGWCVLLKDRRKILEHLSIAFGSSMPEKERRRISVLVFQNLGQVAFDIARIPRFKKADYDKLIIKDDVFDKIDEARKHGRGLLCLTGHVGNWELITAYVIANGYRGTVIAKRVYYQPFNRVIEKIRLGTGTSVFYRDEPPKRILKWLRENQLLGILSDQDVKKIDGIFVPFFGKSAYTPTAPAKLSLASGAPILPLFMIRQGLKYRLISDRLIWPKAAPTKEEAVRRITEQWSLVVESVIRQFPEQWVWMHRRWKTQPAPERENSWQSSESKEKMAA